MLSRRTSLRTAVAVLGAGAALALSMSSPAFAANEGDHWLNTANCTADQKIELHLYSGVYHDAQAIDPTRTNGNCEFILWDNQHAVYDSFSGAQSPWFYDGPGHSIQASVIDHSSGQTAWGVVN
ncbi:hypothetical protein E6W39_08530 [Kitasatospora acidiphila]|uniref:Uncharacterized protein n=1 Tax=Kitasatospora acidiphila TaxID=2567942 RepID=A0A540W003_9ACTN|nr:hypothetical protein [Kitasatospora acidiphila]TQF02313.1 hypothetical protein E6W39_08530 [Kitasatospora acidiphila]